MKPIAGNLGHIRRAIMRDVPRGPTDIYFANTHNISHEVGYHWKMTVTDPSNKDCDCFTMQAVLSTCVYDIIYVHVTDIMFVMRHNSFEKQIFHPNSL